MVRRERGKEDQRVVRLYLTPAGEAALARAPRPLTGILTDALGKLPEESLTRLNQDLALLIAQMGEINVQNAEKPLSEL